MKSTHKSPPRKNAASAARAKSTRKLNSPGAPAAFFAQLRDFLARNTNAFLIAALAMLLLQDIFGNHGVLAMFHSQKQAAEIRKQIDDLDAENRKLQDRVKSLKNDPAAIERIAREEMGLARPGEYIFKIPPKQGDAQSPSVAPDVTPRKP